MSVYKSYQHIEKLGSSEVEGILNGTCYLTYKIDGTNGCIFLKDDGTIGFGSRRRELSLDNDNASFMSAIVNNPLLYHELKLFFELKPDIIIYGEWLVPGTLKTYNKDAWRKFYVFDMYDTTTNKYIPYEEMKCLIRNNFAVLDVIPLLAKLENPTQEDIEKLLDRTGEYLVTSGLGEGIVIRRFDFVNKYGRTTWAKMLTEDFKNKKNKVRSENKDNKEEFPTEHEIITKFLTPEHIQKEYNKLIEIKGDWSSKYIFELLNRVFTEFFKDNWEIILKKFHMPTINFRVLKSLCDNEVKRVLNI